MLTDERQYKMTELIRREGKASIAELSRYFGVSGETVRRDLSVICADGQIRKVHGGAVAIRQPVRDESYALRQIHNARNKQRIGELAATCLSDNQVIGIDAGTCAEGFAREIHGVKNLTVITPSIPVATILAQKLADGEITGSVCLLGGTIHPETGTVRGMTALAQVKQYKMDLAFLAVTAITEEELMSGSESDSNMTTALLRRSHKAFVLAESEKLCKQSYYHVAELHEITGLITDDQYPISDSLRLALKEATVTVHVASLSEKQ